MFIYKCNNLNGGTFYEVELLRILFKNLTATVSCFHGRPLGPRRSSAAGRLDPTPCEKCFQMCSPLLIRMRCCLIIEFSVRLSISVVQIFFSQESFASFFVRNIGPFFLTCGKSSCIIKTSSLRNHCMTLFLVFISFFVM